MLTMRNHLRRPAHTLALAGLWLGALWMPPAITAAELTNQAPLAVWDTMMRATAGGGYRDNVLRTSVAPENSSFFIASADAMITRLSENGSQFLCFFLGEDIRYFDAPSVDKEQLLSATIQYDQPAGPRNKWGGDLQYFYQYAVLDVSETEVDLRRILVQTHGLSLRPTWEHILQPGWSVELEASLHRQFYRSELDDFSEGAARFSLIHRYGHRSEFSLGYQSKHRLYDTREQFDEEGLTLSDTSLIYWQHLMESRWQHYWDKNRHWRSSCKGSVLFSRDNGSGYFDYDRILFSNQLRWRNHGWEIKAQGRFGWYFYRRQTIAEHRRHRAYYVLNLNLERRIGKYWLLYATAEREWNRSNDPLDEYRDWMANAGLGAEF